MLLVQKWKSHILLKCKHGATEFASTPIAIFKLGECPGNDDKSPNF